MFKRIKIFLMCMLFVLIASKLGIADTEVVKFYTVENATSIATTTYISTSTVVLEQSRILGFSVNPHSTGVSQGALWDETSTTTHSTANMFGEMSNPASKGDAEIFPYPKKLTNQLCITLSANSNLIVYYTK